MKVFSERNKWTGADVLRSFACDFRVLNSCWQRSSDSSMDVREFVSVVDSRCTSFLPHDLQCTPIRPCLF